MDDLDPLSTWNAADPLNELGVLADHPTLRRALLSQRVLIELLNQLSPEADRAATRIAARVLARELTTYDATEITKKLLEQLEQQAGSISMTKIPGCSAGNP